MAQQAFGQRGRAVGAQRRDQARLGQAGHGRLGKTISRRAHR
jgi:hypothetical protein